MESDQQLLKALSFGRFNIAEALIQAGADINALTSAHELDEPSVLADAIFEEGFRPDLIVDFALTHGLDPSAHNGLHILKPLAYLCDCNVNLYTLRAFIGKTISSIVFGTDTDKKGPFGTFCLLRDRGVLAVSELKNQFSLTFTS